MDQRFRAFMLTAETLNMSETARIFCVTHQCISNQIRSLEKEYNTVLFSRKPSLALTPEGEALLSILVDIHQLEESIPSAISDSNGEPSGNILIGIPESRYGILVPVIVSAITKSHPKISLTISGDYSSMLDHSVKRGLIDMAIAAQQPRFSELESRRLITDKFYLLISRGLYCQLKASGINIGTTRIITPDDIARLPMIMFPPQSRMRIGFERYYEECSVKFKPVFETNRNDTFEPLARENVGACIIPHMFLPKIIGANISHPAEKQLLFFPIDLDKLGLGSLDLMLINKSTARLTQAKQAVILAILRIFREIETELEGSLEKLFEEQCSSF